MGTTIVHKDGLFFEFSSVSDMPSSRVMPRPQFEAYYLYVCGLDAAEKLAKRMGRAVLSGSSSLDGETAEDAVKGNVEGLSLDEILLRYRCKGIGGMGIEMALPLARKGVRIRRKGWDTHVEYRERPEHSPLLWLVGLGGDIMVYHPCCDDALAGDWETAEEGRLSASGRLEGAGSG
jgi:hypothetical protein